jgi:hypothetical protein
MDILMRLASAQSPVKPPSRHGLGDFVQLRTPSAIVIQNEVKAQSKKAFVAVLAISSRTLALTLKATVQYSAFSS